MLRTKASSYAIMAVAEIASRQRRHSAGVQAAEVARHLHLPAAYVAKVLTTLARAGILRSDRGPHGGFRLARPAGEIDLLEIIEAVDGAIAVDFGLANPSHEGQETVRAIKAVFTEIMTQVRTALRGATVARLIREENSVASLSSAH